jgi:hypothetical protein
MNEVVDMLHFLPKGPAHFETCQACQLESAIWSEGFAVEWSLFWTPAVTLHIVR